jgi:hypothetical protein
MPVKKIQRNRSELTVTGGAAAMTIPQLRKAFERMEQFAGGAKSAEDVQREWKKIFGGKGITKDQAKSYLNEYKQGGRQSGGTAPGLYTAAGSIPGQATDGGYDVYGSYPKYLMSGFDVGVPRMSAGDLCGKAAVASTPLPGMGSNLVGGGQRRKGKKTRKAGKGKKLRKTLRGGNRLPEATNPTTALQDAGTYFRGQQMGASPSAADPVSARLYPAPYTHYAGQVTPIYRTMGLDITRQ